MALGEWPFCKRPDLLSVAPSCISCKPIATGESLQTPSSIADLRITSVTWPACATKLPLSFQCPGEFEVVVMLAWFRAKRLQLGEWLYWRRLARGRAIARLRRRRRRTRRTA